MPGINTANAINQGLTAQHIATNLQNYEAARSSFFVFELTDLNNFLKPDFVGGIDDADADQNFYAESTVEDAIRLNVVKCSIPHYELTTQEYKRGNDVVKFVGAASFGDGSLVVDDVVGLDTKSILMAWLRLAYDPHTFKVGRMKDYKKTCTLIEYTADYQKIRSWTLYGCFITKIDENEFDREADDKRQLTATLVYDRAIMNVDTATVVD